MTVFDLVFIILFLATVIVLIWAVVAALRGHRARAKSLVLWLGGVLTIYLGVVVVASLASPARVLKLGDNQCFDDWCIAATEAHREAATQDSPLVVTLRLSSRARQRPQRELGVQVYIKDDRGRRYDPVPGLKDVPFDVLLQPQEAVTTTRVFRLPADAQHPALVVSHGSRFPTFVIIADPESMFHAPTEIRLD